MKNYFAIRCTAQWFDKGTLQKLICNEFEAEL